MPRYSLFSTVETQYLWFLIQAYGRRWKLIAQFFPGKTRRQVERRGQYIIEKMIFIN